MAFILRWKRRLIGTTLYFMRRKTSFLPSLFEIYSVNNALYIKLLYVYMHYYLYQYLLNLMFTYFMQQDI